MHSFKYDVFLSYSPKDGATVRQTAERLHNDGVKVWFDEWIIKPGNTDSAKKEDGLEGSRTLVFCMSANAFGPDWGHLESETFRFRDPLNKERRLLALRLDDAPIKSTLANVPYLDWAPDTREQSYAGLLEACQPPTPPQESHPRTWMIETASPGRNETGRALGKTYPFAISYAFSKSGWRALTADFDGRLRLWDLRSGECCRTWSQQKKILHVEWSEDERRALIWSQGDKVKLVDLSNGKTITNYSSTLLSRRQMDCFRLLACGLSSEQIQRRLNLYVTTVENHLKDLRERLGFKRRVELRRFITLFYSGSRRSSFPPIRVHQVWAPFLAWKIEMDRALSKRSAKFAELRLCTALTAGPRFLDGGKDNAPWELAWKADNRHVAIASHDGTVSLWDVQSASPSRVFEGHIQHATCVDWDPTERFLLSGSIDGSVRLWDTENGSCLRIFHLGAAIDRVGWTENAELAFAGDCLGCV